MSRNGWTSTIATNGIPRPHERTLLPSTNHTTTTILTIPKPPQKKSIYHTISTQHRITRPPLTIPPAPNRTWKVLYRLLYHHHPEAPFSISRTPLFSSLPSSSPPPILTQFRPQNHRTPNSYSGQLLTTNFFIPPNRAPLAHSQRSNNQHQRLPSKGPQTSCYTSSRPSRPS
ncbi:hypothetical protein B9Z19DRAFT_67068 [Tuber borchii]|uniref:Uncharacterized protein n=1 Tax=Tuber borchii TaxID=42251 RepID=A0A2T6ZSU7_TUBBO|nr:hypothetical protein B9Z19DRAFT_67068 [Tuber borchii]